MTDKNDLILFGVGILLGGFFIYVMMSRNTQPLSTLHLSPSTESYKNNEKWELIRDNNGKLIDIEMIKTPQ